MTIVHLISKTVALAYSPGDRKSSGEPSETDLVTLAHLISRMAALAYSPDDRESSGELFTADLVTFPDSYRGT